MQLPTQNDLRRTFDELTQSSCDGIHGVMRLEAGIPKTKVVLSAMTHGDEPSGLGAFRFLIDHPKILKDVELILAIHNIDGGARWFTATSQAEKHACRALGWNFNRLPLDFPEVPVAHPALQRVRDLWRHIYPDTAYALDMHSADQPLSTDGLTLDIAGEQSELDRISDAIPATARFCGITPLQMSEGSRTKPIGTVFGGPGKTAVSLEVESDSHESPNGIQIAVTTALAMLSELGCLIDEGVEVQHAHQDVYDVLAATMVPATGYRFVSDELLKSFVPITEGQCLLRGPLGDVLARNSGCLIFAPLQVALQDGDEKEEVCFELSHARKRSRSIRLPNWEHLSHMV